MSPPVIVLKSIGQHRELYVSRVVSTLTLVSLPSEEELTLELSEEQVRHIIDFVNSTLSSPQSEGGHVPETSKPSEPGAARQASATSFDGLDFDIAATRVSDEDDPDEEPLILTHVPPGLRDMDEDDW